MYLQRLSSWSSDNKYYKEGGKFNTFTGSVQMPNCTDYAFLRMNEETDSTKRQNYWIKENGGFGNAKTWYSTTTLPKGSELKEGAIVVFDGNCGHVAIVEVKIDDTHAILSQSQYDDDKSRRDSKYWNTIQCSLEIGKATIGGVGKLIGYIYPPINDLRTDRDSSKNQVKVTETYVNSRKSANGELTNKGCYFAKGIYNVIASEKVGEYQWYQIGENNWIREGEWLIYYPVSMNDYQILYEKTKKELETLKEEIKKLVC